MDEIDRRMDEWLKGRKDGRIMEGWKDGKDGNMEGWRRVNG